MLGIDWRQILLHLLNFAILFCILYFLLYTPVKKFMKKRQDYYKDMDDNANKKVQEAEELKSSYEEKMAKSDDEIALKEKDALDKLSQEIELQKEEANKEAEKIVADAKKKSLKERDDILIKTQKDIQEIATSMAEKIVSGDTSKSYDDFLDEVKDKK